MTSLIPANGLVPWGDAFKALWEVSHNDDGTQKNTGLRVFNAYDFGAKGDNTTDDWAALTAWINAATASQSAGAANGNAGNILYLPSGIYRTSAELVFPSGTPVAWLGAGKDRSIISPLSDFGAGKYVVRSSTGYGGFQTQFQDIGLKSSNVAGAGWVKGVSTPIQMNGWRVEARSRFIGCSAQGFYGGFAYDGNSAQNDHTTMFACRSTNNWYSLWFSDGSNGTCPSTLGDLLFLDCDLSGCYKASVAVSMWNAMLGFLYEACHFGFGPYAFYIEGGTGASGGSGGFGLVSGGSFLRNSVEFVSNGIWFDQAYHDSSGSSQGVQHVNFNGFDTSTTGSPVSSIPHDYTWETTTMQHCVFDNINQLHMTKGWLKTTDLHYNDFGIAGQLCSDITAGSLVLGLASGVCSDNRVRAQIGGQGGYRNDGFIGQMNAATAGAAGDVVQLHPSGTGDKIEKRSAAPVAGVAAHSTPGTSGNELVAVINRGQATINSGSNTIAAGDPLTADSTSGNAKTAGTGDVVIGYAKSAASSNTVGAEIAIQYGKSA